MTGTDRQYIAGEDVEDDNKRYQAVSRVRDRFDELEKDIEILAENHPELFSEVRRIVCEDAAGEAELRGRLQDALEARDDAQAQAESLREELDDCRDLLADARERSSADVDALQRAHDDIEAAAERGDGAALQDALDRAKGAIEDA